MPRTPDGKPDLQGFELPQRDATERPPEFADKEFLDDQDVAVAEKRAAELLRVNRPDGLLKHAPWWLDYGTRVVGTGDRRSSSIQRMAEYRR
jgi:hypothetical protein